MSSGGAAADLLSMAAKPSNNKKQEVEVQQEPPQIYGGKLTHSKFSASLSRGAAISRCRHFLLKQGLLQANSWWLDNS